MGADRSLTEPLIAFCVQERDDATLEVRVNFGVFAGRNATQAEIDDLARSLHGAVKSFSIVAEERHEFGDAIETSLRQIVIEVGDEFVDDDADELCETLVERAETWASHCIRSRPELGELGSEL
jgi:hypothetical protein